MYVLHYALWSGNLYVKLNYLPTIFHVYGTLVENLSHSAEQCLYKNVSLPRNFNIPRN